MSENFKVKWNSIQYNAERNIVELLLYEAEKVIAKIQVEIQEEVNEQNPEKFERRYAELERQHSHFQRKLDQRRRKKWKKVKERNIKNHEKNNILASTGINSSSSIIQSKVVNKTRNETINNSLFQAGASDSIQLKKGNVSFSQLERTATEKLRNSGDGFSNFANARLKVDETFITDNRIARKNKKSYAEAVRYDNTSTCANTTDLSKIYCELLTCEKSNSSNSGTYPPDVCTNSAEDSNSSNSQISQNGGNVFFDELFSILQNLQQNSSFETNSSSKNIVGYFCSDTVFNLSSKVYGYRNKFFEKGLDFAPIQNKINQPELRKDFEEFCRRMRSKWHFRNNISGNFSEKPAFTPKFKWKPPKCHPNLEVFLSQIEKKNF